MTEEKVGENPPSLKKGNMGACRGGPQTTDSCSSGGEGRVEGLGLALRVGTAGQVAEHSVPL